MEYLLYNIDLLKVEIERLEHLWSRLDAISEKSPTTSSVFMDTSALLRIRKTQLLLLMPQLAGLQAKNSEDKREYETTSFRKASEDCLANITDIGRDLHVWRLEPTERVLVEPSEVCRERLRIFKHFFSLHNEAGVRIILDEVLVEFVGASGIALRVYPETSLEACSEPFMQRIKGRADYTMGTWAPVLPPVRYHVVAIEAKAPGGVQGGFWQCVAQVACLYKARADVKLDGSSWGIVSDGTEWMFIHIDYKGGLWRSDTFSLKRNEEDQAEQIHGFLNHIVQCCSRVCGEMPLLPELPEVRLDRN